VTSFHTATYFLTAPLLLASTVVLLWFREPRLHQVEERQSLRRQVATTYPRSWPAGSSGWSWRSPGNVPWRSWAAEGLRLLDRNDEARVLAADELALARGWGDPQAIGAALRVLGLVEGGTAGRRPHYGTRSRR
jgi:hypothetical protein